MNRVNDYEDVAETRCFSPFGPLSRAIAQRFGVPGRFLMLHEPYERLSRRRKNWVFLSFRVSFMGL